MRLRWGPLIGPLTLTLTLILTTPASADDFMSRFTVNGFTNFEFEKQIGPNGFGDPNASFDVDDFGLVLNVHASDRVRVTMEVDWNHGVDTSINRGSLDLEYGFLEYTVSDLFKVRVGKFLTPFGIFNEVHNIAYSFVAVKLPSSTNKTGRVIKDAKLGGLPYLFSPRYGAGIALHGDGSIRGKDFNYDILFSNGDLITPSKTAVQTDLNPFENDTNGGKAITARFRFEPSSHLRIGNSFYYDHLVDPGITPPPVDRIVSDGLELEFTQGKFRFISEAALGWMRTKSGDTIKQLGWYLQGSYRFDFRLTPYIRLEGVDIRSTPDDAGTDLITGLNYELSKNLVLKLENNHFQGGDNTNVGRLPGKSYNEIKAALSFGF